MGEDRCQAERNADSRLREYPFWGVHLNPGSIKFAPEQSDRRDGLYMEVDNEWEERQATNGHI